MENNVPTAVPQPQEKYVTAARRAIGDNVLNIDTGFQEKVYRDEGLVLPPQVDDMGRTWTPVGDHEDTGSPVNGYFKIQNKALNSNDPGYLNRILIGTPTTGNIRMEWALARWGQIIPTNWSQILMMQYLGTYAPIQYLVHDAQNLIVKEFIEKKFEWLFLHEHDVILPVDAFVRINAHIRSEENPIVSGLYFTKSIPAEPMVYRGRGNSYFNKFKVGDYVWADGVPTGCLLIHRSIIQALWDESPEYTIPSTQVRTKQVFNTPRDMWYDPLTGQWNATTGTSDLDWCTRIVEGDIMKKAGWPKHAKKRYPFLIDTNIYCKQIDDHGVTYPVEM